MKTKLIALVAVLGCLLPIGAHAVIPDTVPNLPILGAETKTGSLIKTAIDPVAPTPKTVDGNIDDWTGQSTNLGGTTIYSHGELIYQDFIGDAWGADDGSNASRMQTINTINGVEPRTYRLDALQQAAGAQFGAPAPIGATLHYGETSAPDALRNEADIEQVRVAADETNLYFLIRTTGMLDSQDAAALILLQTEPGGSYQLPPGAGGITTAAKFGFLASRDGVQPIYKGFPVGVLCSGACAPPFAVAMSSSGYTNSIEVSVRRDFFDSFGGLPTKFNIGVATGIYDATTKGFHDYRTGDAKSTLLNVAFRTEPARIWMDENQAFALRNGNIDQFLYPVDISKLTSGYSESFQMRPGYYEAIYEDQSTPVNFKGMQDAYFQGAFQHYGVYLPSNYRDGYTYPATFWMHYRGGHAHDAAAWEPNILRSFGDNIGAIVITPSARGESSWYTGRGMVDFLDVWNDAMKRWSMDPNRVYLAGHSMGGWASNLLGILMPDRWAASNPEDGLLCPCLWSGVSAPMSPQEGADINAEFLEPLISNTRNVPYAILHGTEDELVPVTGAIAQSLDYLKLGYRYRFYQFHAYEHYSAPIWDDWSGIVNYMKQFTRDPNPAHVTFSNRPALDHAVSTISAPQGVDLGLHFDHAYWVSELRTRTAGLDPSNVATIDATTSGRGVPQYIPIPDVDSCDQIEPCTVTGQRWLPNGTTAPSNSFTATLTNVGHVTLDVARMGLGTSEPITATITSDGPSELLLEGSFPSGTTVSGASATLNANGLMIEVPSGSSAIAIQP
ncbi:MAG: carboxylesterase family protein [Actinomycetota bacterium]